MLEESLKSKLTDQQWRYIKSLESTQKIADIIFTCRDRDTLISKSLDSIMEFTHFDAISMLLLNEDKKNLKLLATRGLKEETVILGKTLPVNGSFSGLALTKNEIIHSGHIASETRMYKPFRDALAKNNLSSAVTVPLVYNNIPYGVINIMFIKQQKNLSKSDYETLQTIRTMLSLALSNVDYLEKLEKEIGSRISAENDLKDLNEKLENMVELRTRSLEDTLKELQSTQSYLIESEKMASLGGLVAGISHEINTPLGISKTSASHLTTTVKGLTSAFREDRLTMDLFKDRLSEIEDSSNLLSKNIDRAAQLIKSFKKVAVSQSDERIFDFHLEENIRDIITTLSPKWKTKDITFSLDLESNLSIRNYSGALSQVITNLIMNSLIHGFENRLKGEIYITAEKMADICKISYSDNGCGLKNVDQDKIFEPFYTTKRGKGGSGIGLYLLYNLVVHKMKGEISRLPLDSGLGFTITIPSNLSDH